MTRRLREMVVGLVSIGLAGSAWAGAPLPTDEEYLAIQTAFLQENFAQVVSLARPVLSRPTPPSDVMVPLPEQTSRMTRVWLWYALSLEQLKRTNEALRELDRLKAALDSLADETAGQVGADRLWPEVLFWEGEISRRASQLVRGRIAYQRLLTTFPNSSWRFQASLGLGRILFEQQAYEGARELAREVAAAAPTPVLARDALLLEALCDVKRGQFAEALALLDELLKQPLEAGVRTQALFYQGEALTGLGRFDEASQVYQGVLEADPASLWGRLAHFGLGWSAFQQHRCRESLQAFAGYLSAAQEAKETTSSRAEDELRPALWFARGRCFVELGDETQALAQFAAIRRQTPTHPLAIEASFMTAELLARQQRTSEAIDILESVLQAELTARQRRVAHVRLGSLWLVLGEAAQATAQFGQAADAEELEVRQAALNGLGDTEALLDHPELANQRYEESQRLAPTSEAGLYAAYQWAHLQVRAGRLQEAIERFQWLAGQAGASLAADARVALAFALLSNAQPDAARAELKRIRADQPASPQAARAGYYLALLALHDGHIAAARRLCREVIHRLPQSDEALEARLLMVDLTANQTTPEQAMAKLEAMFASLSGMTSAQRGKLAKKLGDVAHQARAYAQAIRWYDIAWYDLPAQQGELDYQLASCYEEGNDLEVANSRYRIITQAPWQVRGQLAAAKLMERGQQWREAMRIYESVAQQPVPEAKVAQERLMVLGRLLAKDAAELVTQ